MARNIGIYSGSFDPVHEGHIAFAKEAAAMCDLETIIFMPERFPRSKPNVTPISERLTELEIALTNTPFKVLNAHADQFTVDETLTELEALYPDMDFTFLMGSDVALNLQHWKNIERLASRYTFAIGMRQSETKESVESVLHALTIQRYVLVTTPYAHLSSSGLRSST
jgi:nicotinate-nucleotide adenylyltransferase